MIPPDRVSRELHISDRTSDGGASAAGSGSDPTGGGSVHGFSVRSELPSPFVYLRDGNGEPLRIRGGPPPSEPGRLLTTLTHLRGSKTRVYEGDGRYAVHFERGGWFTIEPDRSTITIPLDPLQPRLEGLVWGLPTALLVLSAGGLFFHAAGVEINGRAVILTGPTHHGKTTLAGALAAAGYRLLAEDLLRVRVGSPTLVYPGPAMIRLRRDVAEWLSIPGATRVDEDLEKIHYALAPHHRGTADPIPLAGVFLLHPGATPALEPLPATATIQHLWVGSLNIPTTTGRARCFHQIVDLAESTPVWKLSRPVTPEALEDTMSLIVSVVGP